MSRSRKKQGVIKDKGFLKSSYNRMFRRINKQRIHHGKEPKLMREIVNDYDVCDYILYWEDSYQYGPGAMTYVRRKYLKRKRRYFNK